MLSRIVRWAIVVSVCLLASSGGLRAAEMTVHADLREAPRGLFHVAMTLPVQAGPLTLLYPKWIPGEHGPTGPLRDFSGLKISAGGKPLAWRRDLVNLYAFHLEVPAGVTSLDVSADYLGPTGGQFSSGPTTSAKLAVLNWHLVVLYPSGMNASDLTVKPSITLPEGW